MKTLVIKGDWLEIDDAGYAHTDKPFSVELPISQTNGGVALPAEMLRDIIELISKVHVTRVTAEIV